MSVRVTAGTAGSALGVGATPVITADGNPYRSLVSSGETDSKDSLEGDGGNRAREGGYLEGVWVGCALNGWGTDG